MAVRGRGGRSGKGACASCRSTRSFVRRCRSGPALPAPRCGTISSHDVTGPCEEGAVGRGAAGGNARRGLRGPAEGRGLWKHGPWAVKRPRGRGNSWREGGGGARAVGTQGRGKCWREGSTRGAGRRASTPGCLRSRPEGRVEFAGCIWGLVVDPRGPLRSRERGSGAPHRPVPPRQAGSSPHVCEFRVRSSFRGGPEQRAEAGPERPL